MMKRILILITVMLLLSGCGKEQAQPVETTAPTEPPVLNLYVPQSTVEQQTSGAVRSYAQGKQFAWITPVNEGVLVASVEEKTTLMLLSGVDGRVLAEKELQLKLMADSVWTATATGFAYYDSSVREVVYLDPELKEINRLSLPEGVSGSPAIAADASQVYYCIDETIYAIDAERKISRPVRTNTCESQILLGSYFDGKIVGCS
ncbi:MAG: hypothetical protein J6Q54_01560, partial [Oscillospiraceae bacterium]|nr:hypothetical protein [Oscillospiraceae bacterium]